MILAAVETSYRIARSCGECAGGSGDRDRHYKGRIMPLGRTTVQADASSVQRDQADGRRRSTAPFGGHPSERNHGLALVLQSAKRIGETRREPTRPPASRGTVGQAEKLLNERLGVGTGGGEKREGVWETRCVKMTDVNVQSEGRPTTSLPPRPR